MSPVCLCYADGKAGAGVLTGDTLCFLEFVGWMDGGYGRNYMGVHGEAYTLCHCMEWDQKSGRSGCPYIARNEDSYIKQLLLVHIVFISPLPPTKQISKQNPICDHLPLKRPIATASTNQPTTIHAAHNVPKLSLPFRLPPARSIVHTHHHPPTSSPLQPLKAFPQTPPCVCHNNYHSVDHCCVPHL